MCECSHLPKDAQGSINTMAAKGIISTNKVLDTRTLEVSHGAYGVTRLFIAFKLKNKKQAT